MADNVGPPVSGGSQGRNLEDVSILTWSKDNVKAWLKKEDYSKCIDSLAELNGKRLAKARIETLTTYLGDKAVAMDLWEAVGVLLLRQQKKNLFEDYDEYESIMDTRGTPVQSGNTAAPPPGQETDNLATLPRKVEKEITPQQHSASDFKSSSTKRMKWVGCSYDIPWEFDPTRKKLVSQFIPIESEEDEAAVSAICNILWKVTISTHDMKTTHEDGQSYSSTVQNSHLLRLAEKLQVCYGKDKVILEDARNLQMSDIDCQDGVVTSGSKSDGYFVNGNVRYGVYEVKNDHTAPKEGLPQAFGVASNLALKLTKDFGESKPCPVMSGNGRLLQFGVVVLALPRSPFFYTTSKVLDLADPGDRKVAARYLHRLIKYGSTLNKTESQSVSSQELQLEFQPHLAYSKPLNKVFMRYDKDFNRSLMDMMRSFTLLWQGPHELRNIVVFPYGIRSPKDNNGDSVLVFDNVTLDKYKIGFPPWKWREKYLAAMNQAVALLHESKVVHMDLYPSNIFWKCEEEEDSISIKIIDWDASAELGSPLSPLMIDALRDSPRLKIVKESEKENPAFYAYPEWDLCYLNVLAFASEDKNQELYSKLANDVKEKLDTEFRTLCYKYLGTFEKLDINLAKSMSSVVI